RRRAGGAGLEQHPQSVHARRHRRSQPHGLRGGGGGAHGHAGRPARAAGGHHAAPRAAAAPARLRAGPGLSRRPRRLGLRASRGCGRDAGAAHARGEARSRHARGHTPRDRAMAMNPPGPMTAAVLARGVGLGGLLVLGLMIVARGLTPSDGGALAFVHLIDLVFHEAGHVIFAFFGRFLGVLGGSLNQVLIPAVCTGYFLWHRQTAAAAVTLFWTGESITDVALYVADGRDMALPLLAEGLVHDWNWILSELSLRN